MKDTHLKHKSTKLLAFALIASGSMFASSAYADFVAEQHACQSDSQSGGDWIGGYYYPGARSAATVQRDEAHKESVYLYVNLLAYAENYGGEIGRDNKQVESPAGLQNNQVVLAFTDPETAPGDGVAIHAAGAPTMVRYGYTFTYYGEAIDANGCKNHIVYM